MIDLATLLDSMTPEQRAGALLALDATTAPMTPRQIEHALREHGVPRSRATILSSTLKAHRIVAIMGGAHG